MTRVYLLLLTLSLVGFAQGPPNCTEDISLINGEGGSTPCSYQDPPNSGNYVFTHSAVEKINIRGNDANIVSLSFPNLVSVEKSIRIAYNQPGAITQISFPSLRTAGSVQIDNNPGLVSIDLPHLMSIMNDERDAYLRIQSNDNLETFSTPLLEGISSGQTAYLQVRYNPVLETIDFPHLRTLEATDDYGEAYVFIGNNDTVQTLSMNNLQRLSAGWESISYLIVDDMLNLEQISFPQLTELLPDGGAYNFNELTVGHCPRLVEFVFPKLERVSVLQLSSLESTRKVMFPNLRELEYLWVWRSCENAESTLKMYICSEQSIGDIYFSDNGLCGPAGYMLYSINPDNAAACDAYDTCQSFTPEVTDCHCGAPGLCTVDTSLEP